MAFVKICPTCRTSNEPQEMMCRKCMGDISGIIPVNEDKKSMPRSGHSGKSSKKKQHFVVLMLENRKKFLVRNGDVVGRKSVGQEFFNDVKTVSRKHVRFVFEQGKWFVCDLNSTNETYLNDMKLNPGEKKELGNKDKLHLSLSMALQVYLIEK